MVSPDGASLRVVRAREWIRSGARRSVLALLALGATWQDGREPVFGGTERQASALPSAAPDTAEVSGTILVDGQPPEWPIRLDLRERISASKSGEQPASFWRSITVLPRQRGAFSFRGVPHRELELGVTHFHFAGGATTVDLDGPTTGPVLQLESKPEVVGRILGADGKPMRRVSGMCELRIDATGECDESMRRSFTTRKDGCFRMPVETAGESASLTLLVQEEQHGYLLHESVRALAPRVDLGDLRLERVRRLRFTVRDPEGRAIPFAFGEVDGPRWETSGPRHTPDGSGILSAVPARPVDVRFGAHRYADRVLRVASDEAIDVVLEPLTTLEVHLVDPCTDHVVLAAERSAFDWDRAGRDAAAVHRDRHWQGASFRRSTSSTDRRIVYEILPRDATLALVGLTPDSVLVLEARDIGSNVLGASTTSLQPGQHAVLELGTPDPTGKLPTFGGQRRPQMWPSSR